MAYALAVGDGLTGMRQPMASATAAVEDHLQLDSIPVIDLRNLSQSELYALSLCSPAASDPRRSIDIVVPKIDRSVFNESAGSRKQTYSRLRLAPAADSTTTMHRRTPHLRVTNPSVDVSLYPDRENIQIVALLKQMFLEKEMNNAELVPVHVDYEKAMPLPQIANVEITGSKRKRDYPKKNDNAVPLMQDEANGEALDGLDNKAAINEIVIHDNVEDFC